MLQKLLPSQQLMFHTCALEICVCLLVSISCTVGTGAAASSCCRIRKKAVLLQRLNYKGTCFDSQFSLQTFQEGNAVSTSGGRLVTTLPELIKIHQNTVHSMIQIHIFNNHSCCLNHCIGLVISYFTLLFVSHTRTHKEMLRCCNVAIYFLIVSHSVFILGMLHPVF